MTVRIDKKFVKARLAERDQTLIDLARESDIGQATLYRIVNEGAVFKSDTLGRLAEVLKCSPVDLIDVKEYTSPLVGAQAA